MPAGSASTRHIGGIDCKIDDEKFMRAIAELKRRGHDMSEVWEDIGIEAMQIVQENFTAEGRPEKWVSWCASYEEFRHSKVKDKARVGEEKILTLSSRLRNSVTKRGEPGNEFHVRRDHVDIGTNVEYAAIHQFGGRTAAHVIKPRHKKALYWPGAGSFTSAGRSGGGYFEEHPIRSVNHPGSKVPARPYLVIPESEFPRLTRIVEEYLAEPMKGVPSG